MTPLLPRMSIISLVFLLSISLTPLRPAHLLAAESVATEEWDITADKITRYEQPQSIVAEGNIVLVKRKKMPPKPPVVEEELTEWAVLLEEEVPEPETTPAELEEDAEPQYKTQVTIKADWAAYDIALSTIKARGNVSVVSDDEQLFADQAEVNLEQETGTFKNATIVRDEYDMHLEGDVVEKIGYKTYHIENGWVVTCKVEEGETAPWSFAASDAVIKQDGYATLKHARFRIKNVPVLYSPWLIVPVKNKRQTGFLFPEISTSENNGFGFNLPFFWSISDSTDLSFYTQYLIERGFMPGLEFRYVKNESDKGMAMATYLHDELSDPSETAYYADTGFTHDNKDRYWIRGKADQEFGSGWITRLDVDIVSDRDYLTEFNTGATGFQDSNERFLDIFGRSLENKTDDQRSNTLEVLKSWGPMSLTGELLAINDVRADKSGDSPLWKLPAFDFTGALPLTDLANLTLNWDADYVNFWREEGVGGHRFDIYPRLSAPVPISPYLESRAEIGLRDTFYIPEGYGDADWPGSDTENRFIYDLHAEVGSTLMRTFGLSGASYSGFRHQVRPYVDYDFIPDVNQDDLPRFDGVDSISERNEFTYGIDNFFDLIKTDMESRSYGFLKIKQSYSMIDDRSDNPFSDINLRLRLKPLIGAKVEYKTDYSVYGEGFVRHDVEGRYRNSRGDVFGLEYIYDDRNNTEQINGLIRAALFANWRARLNVEHSLAENETNEADISLIYQALCWSVELSTQYTPSDTTFLVVFNLANIGSPIGLSY